MLHTQQYTAHVPLVETRLVHGNHCGSIQYNVSGSAIVHVTLPMSKEGRTRVKIYERTLRSAAVAKPRNDCA